MNRGYLSDIKKTGTFSVIVFASGIAVFFLQKSLSLPPETSLPFSFILSGMGIFGLFVTALSIRDMARVSVTVNGPRIKISRKDKNYFSHANNFAEIDMNTAKEIIIAHYASPYGGKRTTLEIVMSPVTHQTYFNEFVPSRRVHFKTNDGDGNGHGSSQPTVSLLIALLSPKEVKDHILPQITNSSNVSHVGYYERHIKNNKATSGSKTLLVVAGLVLAIFATSIFFPFRKNNDHIIENFCDIGKLTTQQHSGQGIVLPEGLQTGEQIKQLIVGTTSNMIIFNREPGSIKAVAYNPTRGNWLIAQNFSEGSIRWNSEQLENNIASAEMVFCDAMDERKGTKLMFWRGNLYEASPACGRRSWCSVPDSELAQPQGWAQNKTVIDVSLLDENTRTTGFNIGEGVATSASLQSTPTGYLYTIRMEEVATWFYNQWEFVVDEDRVLTAMIFRVPGEQETAHETRYFFVYPEQLQFLLKGYIK